MKHSLWIGSFLPLQNQLRIRLMVMALLPLQGISLQYTLDISDLYPMHYSCPGWPNCTCTCILSMTLFANITPFPAPRLNMPDIWSIAPISTPRLTWGSSPKNRTRDRQCQTCRVELLTGEKAGFCCGPNGNRYLAIQPLPPLPDEFNVFLKSPDISKLSWKLDLIFSFAAMETTHAFPAPGNPSFVAIARWVYHRIRSSPQDNTAIQWILYDGFDDTSIPHHSHARDIPLSWIRAVQTSLSLYNPFATTVLSLHVLQIQQPLQFSSASIIVLSGPLYPVLSTW